MKAERCPLPWWLPGRYLCISDLSFCSGGWIWGQYAGSHCRSSSILGVNSFYLTYLRLQQCLKFPGHWSILDEITDVSIVCFAFYLNHFPISWFLEFLDFVSNLCIGVQSPLTLLNYLYSWNRFIPSCLIPNLPAIPQFLSPPLASHPPN